jgi:hypothetical protein
MKNVNLSFTLILMAFLSIIITSCNKNDGGSDNPYDNIHFGDLKIDPLFKFDMTKTIDVTLSINSSNPKEPPQKFYIYNNDPNKNGLLLISGMTTPYLVFKEKVKIPTYLNELWVVRKDVFGGVDKRSFDISSGTLNYVYELSSNLKKTKL